MLLQTSAAAETRTLTRIGSAVVLVAAITALLVLANPVDRRPSQRMSVVIDTPYVGQGVAAGTTLMLHGVKVGEVTNVDSLPGRGVRLQAELQTTATAGLTDAVKVDFRPANYFGVTGINLTPGNGGHALRDGSRIDTQPLGNFTLQALLSRLGEVSAGALTPKLIDVLDRATRYIDGLDPLIETMVITASAVADVQSVSTQQLLVNTAGLSGGLPSFVTSVTESGNQFLNTDLGDTMTEDFFTNKYIATTKAQAKGTFAVLGQLERTHIADLLPLVTGIKELSDVVPGLLRPENTAQTLVELRSRFEKMFAGTPEQRALQVRVVLDSLPAVAAPLTAIEGER